jgi:transcriptional regulator NrdR family protein
MNDMTEGRVSEPSRTSPKFACPFCLGVRSKVIDSRHHPSWDAFRRRRVCLTCQHRYWTVEVLESQKHHNI